MTDGTWNLALVIINIGTALVVAMLSFIMNGLRASFGELSKDLKDLNNAVLGRYMSREEIEKRLYEMRERNHEMAAQLHELKTRLAVMEGRG